jgi:hypothetical protein
MASNPDHLWRFMRVPAHGNSASLVWCWRLERSDGVRAQSFAGFTDLDECVAHARQNGLSPNDVVKIHR